MSSKHYEESEIVVAKIANKATVDLSGKKYGKLMVVGFAGYFPMGGRPHAAWWCRCECGLIVRPYATNLQRHTTSCGCAAVKHGAARRGGKSPLYNVWQSMIRRCHTTSEKGYRNYGARGIRVCERWRHSFPNFLADMGERPTEKHTLDRIDNDGNYEPGNCRWATRSVNNNNTRRNVYLTLNGETHTLTQWSRKLGVPAARLKMRVELGWNDEEVLTVPQCKRKNQQTITWNGERRTIIDWAEKTGIRLGTLRYRLRSGWPPSRALSESPTRSRVTNSGKKYSVDGEILTLSGVERKYGIPRQTLANRMRRRGISMQEAVHL